MIPARRVWAVPLVAALAACGRPAPPLNLPQAESIWRIEVIRWTPDGERRSTTGSTDPRLIEQLLAQLREHNADYATYPGSGPEPEYTISFEARGSLPLVLWIGRDWLGGVDEELEPGGKVRLARRRPLGPAERERLIPLLPAEAALRGAASRGPGGAVDRGPAGGGTVVGLARPGHREHLTVDVLVLGLGPALEGQVVLGAEAAHGLARHRGEA